MTREEDEEILSKWDTDVPVVSINEDTGGTLDTVTLNLPSGEVQIKETESYIRKLADILNSPRIKEEMGEQLVAEYEMSEGLIFRKTTSWYVTNYRIFCLNEELNSLTQIPLKYVEIVIRNSHTFSERTGAIAGGFVGGFMPVGMGFTQGQSTSNRIGDINIVFNGQVIMIIPSVQDPTGLKQLLYQIKKQIHE